jgi:hypothetical protein
VKDEIMRDMFLAVGLVGCLVSFPGAMGFAAAGWDAGAVGMLVVALFASVAAAWGFEGT